MNVATHARLSLLLLTCQLAVGATAVFATTYPIDSVGVERRDGRKYVLHRVDQGQTLYGVARRYGVNVNDIKTANPDLSDGGVRYDQLLRVPVSDVKLSRREQKDVEKAIRKDEKEKAKAAKDTEKIIADSEAADKADAKAQRRTDRREERMTVKENEGVHIVQSGQTLYSLAVRYGVTMAELREWNHLGADGIQVGQSLIVNASAATKAGTGSSTAAKPAEAKPVSTKAKPGGESASARNTTPADEPAPTRLEAKPIVTPEPPLTPGSKPKSKPATTAKPAAEPKKEEPTTTAEPVKRESPKAESPRPARPTADPEPTVARSGRVHSDVGFADVIEGNEPNTKYLALHRSAPVGTLVQVRNDINNQSLYVKVIGKLPDTGINDQVIIRLSARAFEKLSPNGQRFRAEVSYTK
ncbi:LysM peptidoglycan-binding domain-containing protein [Fibrella sp. HMF5335]|uniref:LysM peptidoglycan-binding domain-containing protein n=1 Tax=Fibrella rubiginis TaxID=2817060 RepID=A0A939GGL4_9BACT|nr:LysM peptidoglycan-binding domain-containing protein [Fibrella rubiginis]MBO0936078.1 LysM peptidoglycan-binding domain-containing protein [Fibrella rubiginis]